MEGGIRGRIQDDGGKGERSHSPEGGNGQGQTKPKPGARSTIPVSQVGAGARALRPSPSVFSRPLAGTCGLTCCVLNLFLAGSSNVFCSCCLISLQSPQVAVVFTSTEQMYRRYPLHSLVCAMFSSTFLLPVFLPLFTN